MSHIKGVSDWLHMRYSLAMRGKKKKVSKQIQTLPIYITPLQAGQKCESRWVNMWMRYFYMLEILYARNTVTANYYLTLCGLTS